MKHTAIIGIGLPLVNITFNCADPANSVSGQFGPGETSAPDNCDSRFVSATIAGVLIADGVTVDVTIDGITASAGVRTEDNGRHVIVTVEAK
jgi:hypothetical protein